MQCTDCTSLSEELIQRIHDLDSSLIHCFFFLFFFLFFFFWGGGGGGLGGSEGVNILCLKSVGCDAVFVSCEKKHSPICLIILRIDE